MSELTDVLSAIESLSARGEKLALATIVAVRGSTYRRPGARLLVPEEGEMVGNISGGCLENDVADVAKIVMREGMARIVSFDLTADDDEVWGWGLGCNGAFELFVEPAAKAAEVAGRSDRTRGGAPDRDDHGARLDRAERRAGRPAPRPPRRLDRGSARRRAALGYRRGTPRSSSSRTSAATSGRSPARRARPARSSRCSSRRCGS